MARFFADENFPLPVVEALRRLGHDVVTIADAGKAGQSLPDEPVLRLAIEAERALLTLNRKHFVRLHGSVPNHSGIIVCTLDLDFIGQATRMHDAIAAQSVSNVQRGGVESTTSRFERRSALQGLSGSWGSPGRKPLGLLNQPRTRARSGGAPDAIGP